jgi:cell division protein FtsB
LFARLRPYLPAAVAGKRLKSKIKDQRGQDRGLLSLSQRNALLAERKGQLAHLQAERRDLDARARLMRDDALSRDLVEERARYLLGFSDPRDYVIHTRP